jgi:Tfp pilus assembly protein FimT
LEVVATAFVIAIMAGLSFPMLVPRYQAYQMRSAAWQVAGDLRLARQRAVTTRNTYRFAFADRSASANSNSYVIEYATQPGAAWVQEIPPASGARRGFAGGISIETSSTPPGRTITFNPNGSVVPTGTIRLTGSGGIAVSLAVDQVGRVQVNQP